MRAELEASQHDDTEREKQIWDRLANRELISAHLSVMPEVLPPSEFSTGINRNVVKADSWKWGKMIGWVSFFEVASRFITLVPGRVSLWASDPDCLQLSINKNVSFSELRRLQTGKDEQLVSFDVEPGELLVIGPADASAQRKRYRQSKKMMKTRLKRMKKMMTLVAKTEAEIIVVASYTLSPEEFPRLHSPSVQVPPSPKLLATLHEICGQGRMLSPPCTGRTRFRDSAVPDNDRHLLRLLGRIGRTWSRDQVRS